MDDVNNMDESIGAVEQAPGGISRRDMIKASVVAGGLVWTAPVLLSGKAFGQVVTPDCTENCPDGFETSIAVKITGNGVNCGVSCLDMMGNLPCSTSLATCLGTVHQGQLNAFVTVNNFDQNGNPPTATITLDPNVGLQAVGVNTPQFCFFAFCPDFADTCEQQAQKACPDISGDDRIDVVLTPVPNPGTGNTTTITVTLKNGDGNINHIELLLCLNSAVTGLCH